MKIILIFVCLLFPINLMAAPDGKRLAYVMGCVNCHHQTPKEAINAPPLMIVQTYSFDEFQSLLRTGKTRTGRDLLEISSLMGIVASEQFIYMTEEEVQAVYDYLKNDWTVEMGEVEESKIPRLYKAVSSP